MNNDLISRSALKCLIEQFQLINPKLSVYDVLKIIDNIPTESDRYSEGYSQGYLDGECGADWEIENETN